MAEFFLDPKGFQTQIDSFKSGADSIKELKYSLDKQSVRLQSVDKYMECVEEFNKTMELFGQLLDQDTESMKLIKAKWMNLDSDVATKTLGEILFGK
jgi:type VII secretion effector (TIGR04197 family)